MSNEAPLSISLSTSTAKTTIPMVANDTWAKLRFNRVSQKYIKDKGDALTFEYELVDPTASSDGAVILPGALGSRIFEDIQLYAKADAKDPEWYLKKISKRQDAVLGTGDEGNKKNRPTRPNFDASCITKMTGGIFFGKFKVGKDQNGLDRSEIADVAFPEDMKQ